MSIDLDQIIEESLEEVIEEAKPEVQQEFEQQETEPEINQNDEQEAEQEIDEAVSASMVKRTPQDKIKALSAAMAVKIAKEAGDPLYKKMIKAKNLWRTYKEKIVAKYGNKGKRAAKVALARMSNK